MSELKPLETVHHLQKPPEKITTSESPIVQKLRETIKNRIIKNKIQSSSQTKEISSESSSEETIQKRQQAENLLTILNKPDNFQETFFENGETILNFFSTNEKGERLKIIIVVKKDSQGILTTYQRTNTGDQPISLSQTEQGKINWQVIEQTSSISQTPSTEQSTSSIQSEQTQLESQSLTNTTDMETLRHLIGKAALDVVFDDLPEDVRNSFLEFVLGNQKKETLTKVAENLGYITYQMLEEILSIPPDKEIIDPQTGISLNPRQKLLEKSQLTPLEKAQKKYLEIIGTKADESIIAEGSEIEEIMETLDPNTFGSILKKEGITIEKVIENVWKQFPEETKKNIDLQTFIQKFNLPPELLNRPFRTLGEFIDSHHQQITTGEIPQINLDNNFLETITNLLLRNQQISKEKWENITLKIKTWGKRGSIITLVIGVLLAYSAMKNSIQKEGFGSH